MKKSKTIKGVKGFTKDMTCRDFKFELGKTYQHEGKPSVCNGGFHFCENPLDVFSYYAPGESLFAEVEGSGEFDHDKEDSKISCTRITIKALIGLKDIIEGGLKFIFEKVKWEKENSVNKDSSGAQATGDRSGAQATGYSSGAQATGDRSGAQATGDSSGAQATGDSSGAQATGYYAMACTNGWESKSEVKGKNSVALACGKDSKAKGFKGSWLILAEWEKDNGEWVIKQIHSAPVDGEKIKEDVWYQLEKGNFKEVGNGS